MCSLRLGLKVRSRYVSVSRDCMDVLQGSGGRMENKMLINK
jgi:hypothetical protein